MFWALLLDTLNMEPSTIYTRYLVCAHIVDNFGFSFMISTDPI